MVSKEDILSAHQRIKRYIHKTPVITNGFINSLCESEVYFKCENFQKCGAFKARGATNAVLQLNDAELAKGVITHSSGNHGQALAMAANRAGSKSYIIMPKGSPQVKVLAVKGYGGEVIFCENNLSSREETMKKVQNKTGATFIHPYQNEHIITGQATATLELIQEVSDLDYILVPIGGGGLSSGACLASHFLSSNIKVIGSEPTEADDAYQSLKASRLIPLISTNTIADGLRTSLGDINFEILKKHMLQIITVKEEEIIQALRLVYERMKIIIEPSSAVTVAALIKGSEAMKNKKVGVIISGGNVDLKQLKNYF